MQQKDTKSYSVNQKEAHCGKVGVVGKVQSFSLNKQQNGIEEYQVKGINTLEYQMKKLKQYTSNSMDGECLHRTEVKIVEIRNKVKMVKEKIKGMVSFED